MRLVHFLLPALVAMPAFAGCIASTIEYEAEAARVSDDWSYDGSGVRNAEGTIRIAVSDRTNSGRVDAQVTDGPTRWRVEWTEFAGSTPAHDGGIVRDLTEHGATGIGGPIVPEVTLPLAGWGLATLYRDGAPVRDTGTGDTTLRAHFMVVNGELRDENGRMWNQDRSAPYDPARPADGLVLPGGPSVFLQLQNRDGSYVKIFEFRKVTP